MKDKHLWITLFISLFIISILFFIKGIYPFGIHTFDIVDFSSGYVPVYYKLWDILHGTSGIYFDWNLGNGLGVFASLIMNSLSPSSWLIYFSNRDFIPFFMSYILIIKVLVITLCTYISLKKIFPNKDIKYVMLGSLLYTYSGWTFLMMSNILYLDVIALFPIFIYGYIELVKNGKWKVFLISLILCLLSSFYLSWMLLFFMLFITPIIMFSLPVSDKKKKVSLLSTLTLIALGISCIFVLPTLKVVLSSYRISMTSSGYENDPYFIPFKLLYLLPSVIPITITVIGICKEKNKKIKWGSIIAFIILLIPIVFDSINKLWHTGSYSSFPFRYSFIPIFLFILGFIYYIDHIQFKCYHPKLFPIVSGIMFIIQAILFYSLYPDMVQKRNIALNISTLGQFIGPLFLFVLGIITIFFILKIDKKKRIYFMIQLAIIEMIGYGVFYIQLNATSDNMFQSDDQMITSGEASLFNMPNDGYSYLDYTDDFNMNYAYMIDRPTMGNRMHFVTYNEINEVNYLGYQSRGTLINSKGGTYFSDLLLNNKYVFSTTELSPDFYQLIDNQNNIYLYELKYSLGNVIPYSGFDIYSDSDDYIDNQNTVYQKFTNQSNSILKEVSYEKVNQNYVFNLVPNQLYYFTVDIDDGYSILADINIHLQSMNIQNQKLYFTGYVNQDTKATLINQTYYHNDTLKVYSLSKEDVEAFVNTYSVSSQVYVNKDNKEIDTHLDQDSEVILPTNYDNGLVIKVNGEVVTYHRNIYNMVSFHLNAGDNKIEISYIPSLKKEGIYVCILSLLFLGIGAYLQKKYLLFNNFVPYIYYLTVIIDIMAFIRVYILSFMI